MPLAWIPSYPKSGNTWARIMVTSYLLDEPVPLRVSEMGTLNSSMTDLVDMFHRGRALPLDSPGTVAVKTHFLPDAEVHRPYRSAVTKVLYLVRDPRDV